MFRRFVFQLNLSLIFLFVLSPVTAKALSLSQKAQEAAALLSQRYTQDQPGATYLIAHKGVILSSGAVGQANLEWNIPLSENTLIRIGSISKSMTAIAVLKLAEENKLSLDQPIKLYAKNLPDHMGKRTLRQLLSHRSGIAEHAFDEALLPYVFQPMTTEKIIELQKHKPQSFPPGEKYEYVNFNYVLVAHVVEQITGKSFIEFTNEDIFAAHGLNQSAYDQPTAITPNRAEFYAREKDNLLHSADIDLSHVSAAGAFLSSVEDINQWMNLLVQGKIISKQLLEDAWTSQPLGDGKQSQYGLGFNISSFHGHKYIWHTGLTPGAQSAFGYIPDSEIFIVVLSNVFYWPADTGKLVDEMMEIMLSEK